MNFLNKIFHLDSKQTTLKTEIIGGLITFVAMCYILPVNTQILGSMGMSQAGIFISTALLSFAVTLIMAFAANYPVLLSAGMGLNAYIAFTLPGDFSWQQRMILVTVCGIVFFILSLTPIRRIIIESIPKPLKCMISAALGAFILFVGLKGTGIIAGDASTLVTLGSFKDPAMLVGLLAILLTIGLMFVKNKTIKTLAIPIGILTAAVTGLVTFIIMKENGAIVHLENVGWVYNFGSYSITNPVVTNLPVAPW